MAQASWYDRVVLPVLVDLACGAAHLRRLREDVVPRASGDVLEVGIGTGRNLPFYDRTRVRSIVGVEPSLRMHRLALRRAHDAGLKVSLVGLSAERLPVADAGFDCVVCTFTLCSIPDPVSALREMRRALVPGGRLLFAEHGRAPDAGVAAWQRRLTPAWRKLAGGCCLDRDVPALLHEAGFRPELQQRYLEGPRLFGYHCWGEAVAAEAAVSARPPAPASGR
jgi:ubiquinone/menaquinone biosynthesis C-methylase UbiE